MDSVNLHNEQGAHETGEGVGVLTAVGFPCASCGSQMTYDPQSGDMLCAYCQSKTDLPDREITAPEYLFFPEEDTYDAPNWQEEGMRQVVCASCGADIMVSAAAVTAKCPFCESHYVTELAGDEKIISPETMIPFRVSRESAADSFAVWAKKRFWAPKAFRNSRHRPDMNGVYIPHWTFDAELVTDYRGQGGRDRIVHYTVRVNGKTEHRTRVVTDWFPIAGCERLVFDDQICCASKKVDRQLLAEVGPFSLKVLNVYNPAYLAGFFAERYDIGLAAGFASVKPSFEMRMQSHIQATRGFDHYRFMEYINRYQTVKFKHVLLPVYLTTYTYRKKQFPFLVNGETGVSAGRAPVSALRVLAAVLLGIGAIGILAFLMSL